MNGALAGNTGNGALVRLFGYQDSLSLDARARFRLPDDIAARTHRELGRVERTGRPDAPPAALERLSFYFVPGPQNRVFLYPTPNVRLVVDKFESPPPGMPAEVVRQAREYLYLHMRFVEADRQNRLVIPERLRVHAAIDERVQNITLVAQNYWLALSRTELVEQRGAEGLDAFERVAPDLLDPVYRPPFGTPPDAEPQP